MSAHLYLLRIGVCGETVRGMGEDSMPFARGDQVVLQTDRGEMLARVMQHLSAENHSTEEEVAPANRILRPASKYDLERLQELKRKAGQEFFLWRERIQKWQVDVELVDLEWTLDGNKLILYVLNSRGPESTKLAIQAAAEGLGVIDVVPVSTGGVVVSAASGCGCGSGGCSNQIP